MRNKSFWAGPWLCWEQMELRLGLSCTARSSGRNDPVLEPLLPPQCLLTKLQTHIGSLFRKGLYWCVQNKYLLILVLFSIETGDLLFPRHGQCIFPPFALADPSIRMLHILPSALGLCGPSPPWSLLWFLVVLSPPLGPSPLPGCTHISAMPLLVCIASITRKAGEKDRGLFLFTFVFPIIRTCCPAA